MKINLLLGSHISFTFEYWPSVPHIVEDREKAINWKHWKYVKVKHETLKILDSIHFAEGSQYVTFIDFCFCYPIWSWSSSK